MELQRLEAKHVGVGIADRAISIRRHLPGTLPGVNRIIEKINSLIRANV